MDGARRPASSATAPDPADREAALGFDAPVARGGYRWWYIDALSDDHRCGLTLIAFIGSVFSPYYARARARDGGCAEDHCAVNVALYDAGAAAAPTSRAPSRWAMTERGRAALDRSASHLAIGPSRLAWDGCTLTVCVDEITCPWPSRLRGTIRLQAGAIAQRVVALDAGGRHRWRPLAPAARVELDFVEPRIRWSGRGYLDTNAGDEPLEAGFDRWHWSRAFMPATGDASRAGETIVLYDVTRRDGSDAVFALRYDGDGVAHDVDAPPRFALPPTAWRVARATRAAASSDGSSVRVLRTLEDTPFYARSLLASQWRGQPVTALHESLSLDRFRAPWVRALLPFRMPRRTHRQSHG